MRKSHLLLSLILITSFFNSSAQTFQKLFVGAAIPEDYVAEQTADGGYIVLSSVTSFGAGEADVYLIKTDANGDTLWTKTFGGANNDYGNSLDQTDDGGFIIAGHTASFGAGDENVYLIKTDSLGNALWIKTYGGTFSDFGKSVKQTTDKGYIIAGYTDDFGAILADVYLIKTDSTGAIQWTRTIGGTDTDAPCSVQQTNDGGYIVAGYTNSFGVDMTDAYVVRTDSSGGVLWTKTFGGLTNDDAHSVQQTNDGGYIIAGSTNSFGAGLGDIYLLKLSSDGTLDWSRAFGGPGDDKGYSVLQTIDSGYIVAGYTNSFGYGLSDVYLVKLNGNGDTLWTRTFGGGSIDVSYSIQQANDGGYIIAGNTLSFGVGTYAIYLIKTDADGNSPCNQSAAATIVTTPFTQAANAPSIISTGGTVSYPATAFGSGANPVSLCIGVGLNETAKDDHSFSILPNPSEGNFIISLEHPVRNGFIQISNCLGVTIYKENIYSLSNKQVNLINASNGIYLVKIFDGEKQNTGKLIIQD
ncbi:MAG TPA: T9SS type A sorting domain-containing protein [Chitinophagales bacterium]|nr:T9SS type A sorting domain-containing protein [Chitinophagales bacterium]